MVRIDQGHQLSKAEVERRIDACDRVLFLKHPTYTARGAIKLVRDAIEEVERDGEFKVLHVHVYPTESVILVKDIKKGREQP